MCDTLSKSKAATYIFKDEGIIYHSINLICTWSIKQYLIKTNGRY